MSDRRVRTVRGGKQFLTLLLCTVLLTFQSNELGAQVAPRTVEILGRVSHAGDTTVPIVAAEIEILATGLRTATDAQGRFRFSGVMPGEYDIRARRLGHTSVTRRLIVRENRSNFVEITL